MSLLSKLSELEIVPPSIVEAPSSTAIGVSFAPFMVIVIVPVSVPPLSSAIV